jgi:hypothetical protein
LAPGGESNPLTVSELFQKVAAFIKNIIRAGFYIGIPSAKIFYQGTSICAFVIFSLFAVFFCLKV